MKYIPKVVTRTASMTKLRVGKNSPQILFVAGVAGVVTTTVLACKATLKLEGVLEDAEKQKADAGRALNLGRSDYTEDDFNQDTKTIGLKTTVEIAKLYAPSIILGTLSIAALAGSHNILSKRNAALTAAYATLEKAYHGYRARVIAEYGEDKDREFRFGKVTDEVIIDTPNGPKKKKRTHAEAEHLYSRWFDGSNKNFTPISEQNAYFLKTAQNHCNDRLIADGFLLLNDVYEYLGFKRTTEGCVVGWLRDGGEFGDGYIDFGIFDSANSDRLREFARGNNDEIMLDFNVDGLIYEKLESAENK